MTLLDLTLNGNLNDQSGNVHDAYPVAGDVAYSTGVHGESEGSFTFDHTAYLNIKNSSDFSFEITDAFSIVCDVYFDATAGVDMIISKTDNAANPGFMIWKSGSAVLHFYIIADAAVTITSVSTFAATKWYKIECTYDGTSNRDGMKIYIDGILDVTGTASAMTGSMKNTFDVTLGAESDGSNKHLGRIANMIVEKYEMSQAEINYRFHQGGL